MTFPIENLINEGFNKDSIYNNIFLCKDGGIKYSDGDIENYIYDVLKKAPENEIEKFEYLENNIIDWPTKYHFAWERQNILKPTKFTKKDKVLEIGAGTGIITDYLANVCDEIIAIEGTYNRARCIPERCKGKNNIKIIVSDFLKINFDKVFENYKFDKICLIGVLEYFEKYNADSNENFITFLTKLNGLLAVGGSLLIAIENKIGLKYLLGWKEDHVGISYYGVESRYKITNDVRTFNYSELCNLLKQSNFKYFNFFYPFPDYKLPKIILTDNYLKNNELTYNLIYNSNVENYRESDIKKNNFGRTLMNFVDEKQLGIIANSFLVEASNIYTHSNFFGSYYSNNRRFKYANEINFILSEENNEIEISKKWYDKELISAEADILKLKQSHENIPFFRGLSLDYLLEDLFIKNDKNGYRKYLNKYIKFLNQIHVKTNSFDLIPKNILIDKYDNINFIDNEEWESKHNLNIQQLLFRFFRINSNQLNWLYNHNYFNDNFKSLLEDFDLEWNDEYERQVNEINSFIKEKVSRTPYFFILKNKDKKNTMKSPNFFVRVYKKLKSYFK